MWKSGPTHGISHISGWLRPCHYKTLTLITDMLCQWINYLISNTTLNSLQYVQITGENSCIILLFLLYINFFYYILHSSIKFWNHIFFDPCIWICNLLHSPLIYHLFFNKNINTNIWFSLLETWISQSFTYFVYQTNLSLLVCVAQSLVLTSKDVTPTPWWDFTVLLSPQCTHCL